jgi:hypothetical protein
MSEKEKLDADYKKINQDITDAVEAELARIRQAIGALKEQVNQTT